MISMGFSFVTLLGFAMVWVLPEPYRGWWARYADSSVLALMALLLIPLPLKILYSNLREVLLITSPDNEIVHRVEAVMQKIRAEHDIAEYSTHIAKTGRIHFIEINMVVGPELPLADRLRYVNTFADVVSLDMYFYTVPFCAAGDAYRGHLYDGRIPESTCRTASSYGRFVGALRDLDARDSRLVPIWNFVEVMSGANDDGAFVRYMEPEEIRGAAMSSIINEARGIVWFQQSLGGPCKSTQPVRQAQELGMAKHAQLSLIHISEPTRPY